ncbi:carboxypeptidase-like regulatory domain-containing protein [Chamaesiphon sp. VAR_48_metabat_135_sub]|uniref:carboxypeptidase-like regulatory domain-containing protein n=1 Tax=Chamaesiphon sp. VAR_48_metabat_135_sub TaxID=2964699 RepID=UPI00286A70A1|nr:carboxypeptidase-like regulatory domain-containing protein [Chamaesiphon sp. VAR_48_metabat_135_sub]
MQVILWCGFSGTIRTVSAIAIPLKLVSESSQPVDPQNSTVNRINAIVNNLLSQQISIEGSIDTQSQRAINLEGWLLPFDDTLKLLEIQQRQLSSGELELTSSYLLVRFNPRQLRSHPQLGKAITIGDLQKLPGIKITFDAREVALRFSYTLPKNPSQLAVITPPVSLDGLATIYPPIANLSAVQERINLSGSANNQLNTQGEFKAVGTVFGSSWYLRVEQPKLANLLTWGLSEAVVINQSPSTDWISGSQSPFWRRQGSPTGAYWGVTTIQREDFTPPTSLSGGDFVPNERLQSSQLGRTVAGRAQPGTVVRLVRGFNTDVVGQILVDSSGVFRFENVVVSKEGEFGNNYRLLLYPSGQLTADPQVQDVTFTTVPGQLPVGAGAWIASAGVNYNRGTNQFLGKFDGLQGGLAYRRGISESLTIGNGIIYDPIAVRGLSEVFWQPTGIPLQASVSAVTGNRWDVVSSMSYKPTPTFNANFSSDKLSSRADLNWLLTPTFTATSKYDSLSGVAIGGNYSFSVAPKSTSSIQGTFDSKSFLRWSASHQQNNWLIGLQGNEISLNSEVSYQLPAPTGTTQSLVANYQSTRSILPTTFGQLLWRYQSTTLQSELGYGWSGFGRGANMGIGVKFSPGLQLMGKYQGISAFTNRANFSLELQSTIDLQGGIQVANTRVEDLRTRGGITIKPFFDRNGNGKQDPDEEKYWHPELITLDNKPLNLTQTTQLADSVEVRAAPGSYRLDLNPTHLPAYWRSFLSSATGKPPESLRVNVALGSYTTIPIPLIPIYTVTGVVSDSLGKPLPHVEVVAIDLYGTGVRRSTNSNLDGSYEFADLALGAYDISTPGQLYPATISIVSNSPVLQQLNLRI